MYINYFFLKSTYIRENALSTNPVNTGVKALIKNWGMALWEFCMALWEFESQFQHQVIHMLSTILHGTMGILLFAGFSWGIIHNISPKGNREYVNDTSTT